MNNEDKILSMLDTIALTVGTLVTEQQKTNQRLDSLEQKVNNLDQEVQTVKTEVQTVKAIAIRMENDHGKHLTNLYDAFQVNKDKDNQLEPRVENLEAVTEKHSLEIISLQNAI